MHSKPLLYHIPVISRSLNYPVPYSIRATYFNSSTLSHRYSYISPYTNQGPSKWSLIHIERGVQYAEYTVQCTMYSVQYIHPTNMYRTLCHARHTLTPRRACASVCIAHYAISDTLTPRIACASVCIAYYVMPDTHSLQGERVRVCVSHTMSCQTHTHSKESVCECVHVFST